MLNPFRLLLAVGLFLLSTPAAFGADEKPKFDYATIVVPSKVIAGEKFQVTFRATDDIGLNSIGPVVTYRSIAYPQLFIYFSNCFITSGNNKDGFWRCSLQTENTNPVGTYNLIAVLTDTVGQHSEENLITGWTTIGTFEMSQISAADKAAAEKAAADKAAAEKAAADKAAAEYIRFQKGEIFTQLIELNVRFNLLKKEMPSNVLIPFSVSLDRANLAWKTGVDDSGLDNFKQNLSGLDQSLMALELKKFNSSAAKIQSITCVKGKTIKKVQATNPKCPAGYSKK
jgi:hypothetical protein